VEPTYLRTLTVRSSASYYTRDDAERRDALEPALDGESRRLRASTIHRICKAFNLQRHRTQTFKLSTDPLFVEKVRDIVGLYLSPPEHALVLCVDEKRSHGGG
jgi:hypothetical protein